MTPRPSYDLEAWRKRIPVLASFIPMNNCSHAPQTDLTRAAAEAYLSSWDRDVMDWDTWMDEIDLAKAEFAKLINASPDEIAVASSVSAATAVLASAFDFDGSRSKVLVTEAEFPTVGHVWLAQQKYGARVQWVPVRNGVVHQEDYDAPLDDKTLIVCACHAYYQNGFKQDLAAIAQKAHAHGALVYADAYQTVGIHPVDVKALDVDFLACGAHKFLMGVPGIAFLYVKRELIEQLRPALTGWFGRADPLAFQVKKLDWSPTASRFETATPAVVNAYVCRAGMGIINEIGPQRIREWTDELSRRLISGGLERGLEIHGSTDYRRKTATTAFICPGDSERVQTLLRERGVLGAARGPAIRLAPHFYSSLEDVEVALDTLAEILRRGVRV